MLTIIENIKHNSSNSTKSLVIMGDTQANKLYTATAVAVFALCTPEIRLYTFVP